MFDFNNFFEACYIVGCGIMGLWGFIKVFKEIKSNNDSEVKRRQRIDSVVEIVEAGHEKWDKGLADIYAERNTIVRQYNERLDEQDAKIQDLLSMLITIMQAQDAILEALIEQGIGNGDIKETRKALHTAIAKQVSK